MVGDLLLCAIWYPPPPHTHTEPVFRFTQDLLTACGHRDVAMVIELVSGTLGFPVDINIDIDTVFSTTLTFHSNSSPNTQRNFSTTLSGTDQVLVAVATATPVGVFQSDRASIALFPSDSEKLNACITYSC